MSRLEGKVALVTGAGQGVGRGIATALAREGAAVAVLGRTESKLLTTCDEIGRFGTAIPVLCDVSSSDEVSAAISQVVEVLGGLDILVNNAWSGHNAALLALTEEQLLESFHTGPFAVWRTMVAAHPHLVARGGGAIVNLVSSAMVRWDGRFYGPMASAKHAVRSLTRTAACEWGTDGIRVNAIAPLSSSPALDEWVKNDPAEAEEFFATIPLGRIGDSELDVGRAVVTLVSEDSRFITGATIPLDGGQAYF